MRHPVTILFAICLIVFSGCGKALDNQMTEQEAVETLASVPLNSSEGRDASFQDFEAAVQSALDSGEVTVRGRGRSAVNLSSGKVDLSMVTQIIALLQSQISNGGKLNLVKLVQQLLAMFPQKTAASAGFDISAILALITQLAPIIGAIAPQFAPIIAAITTFLPMILQIIEMFSKPKSSAAMYYAVPKFA